MNNGKIYPHRVLDVTNRIIKALEESEFFENGECDSEILGEKIADILTKKFLDGKDLEFYPDEISKAIDVSVILTSLRKMEKLNLIGSIEDADGIENFFLTEKAKNIGIDKLREIRSTRDYTEEVPEDADVYTVDDFNQAVKEGSFGNYDGSGYWVKDDKMSREDEFFSSLPLDATHVAWFNK
jgi:hypothetical protein